MKIPAAPIQSSMSSHRGRGPEIPILRQPVFFYLRRAVLVWTSVHHRLNLEVAVRRRGGGHPFQGVGVPGISFGFLARAQAPNKIRQKEDLRRSETESAD